MLQDIHEGVDVEGETVEARGLLVETHELEVLLASGDQFDLGLLGDWGVCSQQGLHVPDLDDSAVLVLLVDVHLVHDLLLGQLIG